MIHFDSDYMEGSHPAILKKLMETNFEKTPGYGLDKYSEIAKEKIRKACGCENAEVYFLVGGTQTNAVVIKALLRDYEGVIAANTGHISLHEAGAIEAGGHKVLQLPHKNGKLTAQAVDQYIEHFYADGNHEHMVFPGMVYISHPTEYGTLYTKNELEDLSAVCRKYNIPLYLDGARLGYGLAAEGTDITLKDIGEYCDIFYIGGTKVGALFGEAVVITKPNMIKHFFTIIKQNGALLSKGRILGIQFDTLFTDDLYLKISKNAVNMANKMRNAFREKGYELFCENPTNQVFVILENSKMEELSKEVSFSFWEKYDEDHTVVRFAASWATKEEDVDTLIEII